MVLIAPPARMVPVVGHDAALPTMLTQFPPAEAAIAALWMSTLFVVNMNTTVMVVAP
jgi:hypothetical protein